jgi:hypothetical protein
MRGLQVGAIQAWVHIHATEHARGLHMASNVASDTGSPVTNQSSRHYLVLGKALAAC